MVWTDIAQGDSDCEFKFKPLSSFFGTDDFFLSDCAVLVAFNSVLQMVLFAPFGILYISVISPGNGAVVPISYATVAQSVAVFLGSHFFLFTTLISFIDI